MFASALGLDSAVEELRFRLFPGVYHPFTSDIFSKCLKRDSLLHLGQGIGLADYRDLQSNIVQEHKDPDALEIKASDNTSDLQQGHSSATARGHYLLAAGHLHGVSRDTTKAYRRASLWWQHITGTPNLISTVVVINICFQESSP